MMRSADPAPELAAGAQRRLIPGVVALAGVGLILFGSNQSKLFGAAYLAVLVGLFGVIPAIERAERRAFFASAADISLIVTRAILLRCPWLPRAVFASSGVLLSMYFGIRRPEFPRLVSVFYILLGLLLIAWAVASVPRPRLADDRPGRHRLLFTAGTVICLLPVAALGLTVLVYATNAPFFDEYITTLMFAADFAAMPMNERIAEFVSSHFGHRIVFTRAATLAQLALFGELNFYWMTLFNYVLLCGGVGFIYSSIPRSSRSPLLLAPFLFIFFQPQYHQITLWAFGSPHLSSFCFTAATFLFLSRQTAIGFWLGLFCALVAAFTFATGLFAGLLGLALLLDQRRYREALYWLIPVTMIEMRYFSDLNLYSDDDERLAALGRTPVEARAKVLYALEFLGSLATLGVFSDFLGYSVRRLNEFEFTRYIARIIGTVFLALFTYVSIRRHWRLNAVVYGLLAITMLSAALAADQRAHAVNTAFLSRYMINSCLAAGLLYLALLQLHPRFVRRLLPLILLSSVLFCAWSFLITLPFAKYHQRDLQFGSLLAANGLYQHSMPVAPGLPLFRLHPLMKARDQSVYAIPEREFAAQFAAAPFESPARWEFSEVPEWEVSYLGENSTSYVLFLGPVVRSRMPPEIGVLFADEGGSALAFRATAFTEFAGHSELIDAIAPDGATHYAVVPKPALREGRRRVAVAAMRDQAATVHLSAHHVPTLRETRPALSPSIVPETLHLTSSCSDMVTDADDGCWFEDGAAGIPVDLPQDFTVVMLADMTAAEVGEMELWRLVFPGGYSLQLLLRDDKFALRADFGDDIEELINIESTAEAPNWVAVAVDGRHIVLIAATPNASGALATAQAGESELQWNPVVNGTLYLGDGTNYRGIPAIHLREISIRQGVVTLPEVVANWPLFDLSQH